MHFLIIGTVFCLCLIIVNSKGDREHQEGGRFFSFGLRKRGSTKLRLGLRLRGALGILSSFKVSTGVKGMSCCQGRCRHYGNQPNTTKRNPKWAMKVGHVRYLCYSEDVRDCPQFDEAKYSKFAGKVPVKKLNSYQMVVCGKVYLCQAHSPKECPRVPILESEWEVVTKEKVYILEKGNITIMCIASDIEKCYVKFGRDNWKEEDDLEDYSGISWYIVDEGIKYYCKASKKEDCPEIDGLAGSHWNRYCSGKDVEECEKSEWELIVNGVTIICVADLIEDCGKTRAGDWKPSKRYKNRSGKPGKTKWYTEGVAGAMFYCDEREEAKCPEEFTVAGGRKWVEAPPDDEPSEPGDGEWELKIRGRAIICVTSNVKYCKKVHKGKWKSSNRGTDDDGVPENSRWEISTGKAKIYCDAKSAKHCPKFKRGRWGPAGNEESDETENEPEDELEINQWELTFLGRTIICVAHNVNECKKIHKGRWKHTENPKEDSKWWISKDKTRVYCDEKSLKHCPKVHGGHGWGKNPGNPDDPAPMWQLHVKGNVLICVAFHVNDCKKVHRGHWKPCYGDRTPSGVPDNGKWFTIVGEVKVYCESKSPQSCPNVSKGLGRWQGVAGGSDDGEPDEIWELSVGGGALVCVAPNAKDCRKIRNGNWKPAKHPKKDANGNPEGSKWWIIVGRARAYCKSKSLKSCPTPDKGEKWKKVPGGSDGDNNRKHVPNDRRDVDAGEIAPSVVGGGRFKQSQGDDTICLCYDVDSNGCPEGSKWIETKNEVGEKVRNIITRKNVWVLEIRGTHVVCIAEELSSCTPKNNDGWVIIAGMKAGLWKLTYKGVVVYCEAAEKTNCPEEFGDWVLVSMDQWIQKILELNRKGDMWRMVTFRCTAYCDAKYKGKCPKLDNYLWHKVFGDHIDFSAYGKVIKFKKLIKNASYFCKAKSEDACPELPYNESWEQIDKEVTLEEVLIYFEDIVGFEDNCRSGICKVPKNIKNDLFE